MKKVLFIFTVAVLASCGKKTESTKPERKNLTEAVYASGKIFPKNDYQVFAKLAGYVEAIHVHVGDSVKVGQPLLTIRSEVSALNVDAAKNALALAQKNADDNGAFLSVLRADVNSSQSKYQLDSLNFARTTTLLKQNATSQLSYDQAKTLLDASRATWQKAKANYNATSDRLKTELANAKLQYDAQSSNNSDYTISSAVNGRVYDILPKKGELVGPTIPILEIGDYSEFYVELYVDETDVARLEKDQDILYAIDAFKDREFKGKVVEEYPHITAVNKTSRVIATIEIPNDVHMFSGMSVEANIIIAQKKNILVIPREYLLPDHTVNVKGKDAAVAVKTGAYDLQYIEILEGVTEQDEIIKE